MFKSYYITSNVFQHSDAKILRNPQESRHVPSFFHHFPGTNPNFLILFRFFEERIDVRVGGTGRVGGHHGTELHRADGGHCGGAENQQWDDENLGDEISLENLGDVTNGDLITG